jgi:hypothetical protein
MKDVKAGKDRRIADLEPFIVAHARVLARVDEFAEGEETELDRVPAIDGGARDVPEQIIGQEGDLGADVRQPPVRGNEDGWLVAAAVPEHAQDPDVDPVLEELIAEVFGDGTILALLAQRVILACGRNQPALRRNRGDPSQDRLGFVLQGHQDELTVHR